MRHIVEVGPEGEITIPAELRSAMRLESGMQLTAFRQGGRIMLRPVKRNTAAAVRGWLAGPLVTTKLRYDQLLTSLFSALVISAIITTNSFHYALGWQSRLIGGFAIFAYAGINVLAFRKMRRTYVELRANADEEQAWEFNSNSKGLMVMNQILFILLMIWIAITRR